MKSMLHVLVLLAFGLVSCASTHTDPPSMTQNREIALFAALAEMPKADDMTVLTVASQYLASHREHEGQAFFARLSASNPERPLFRSLEGVMQARVANDIALLKRVAWVEDAIRKLDEGAEREPVLGRYLRGLVFAVLPERFGKREVGVADLRATSIERIPFSAARGIRDALAGTPSNLLADASITQREGFRFEPPHLTKVAPNVYLAEGYDFCTFAFLVDPEGVVAVDAGTTEANATAALAALRREVTTAPIRHVLFTHAHWDHVGGARRLVQETPASPLAQVWATDRFPGHLARIRDARNPYRAGFWGTDPIPLEVAVDHQVATETALRVGSLDLVLSPGPSGETSDALWIHDRAHGLLFVGDAFMPYVGPPFGGEGSTSGYIEAAQAAQRHPATRLVHGHAPLTRYWTKEAMPGLATALVSLRDHVLPLIDGAQPLADALHESFVPPSLAGTPAARMPFGVVHDTFVQRLYRERAGYWESDGTGMDAFTAREWSTTIDLLAGRHASTFVDVTRDLVRRGDAAMALRVADLGLLAHPGSADLRAARGDALAMLQARYQQVNPFRYIVYSTMRGVDVPPVLPESPRSR